jgi:death-on-curing protein
MCRMINPAKHFDESVTRATGMEATKRNHMEMRVKAAVDGDTRARCVERILRIHNLVIALSGEEREKGLEDAVINPMAFESFCDWIELCPDCFSKAALAIDYIANFHPFMEGNKRTAFQLSLSLLRNGGYEPEDDEATFLFIKDVASGMYDRSEIEDWLKSHTHLSNP